ncbi:MAG TPA: SH3 domain-containing protein [Pseudonocardiaceae bacterium]
MRRPLTLVLALLGLVTALGLVPPAPAAEAALSSPPRGTTIRAVEGVNLRTGPSTGDAVITVVPAGHTASVLSATPSNGFYRVNYQGSTGWTHGDYWNAVPGIVVNGYQVSADEERWLRWIAANTVARVEGSRATKLTTTSRVAWWSLKEGVLELNPVHPYSNCAYPSDHHIGPLETCPAGYAWQVGIAAAQVPNYPMSTTEATALRLYPGSTITQVLAHTANYAGYATGTATHTAIVNSTGSLRNSWLLRNHGVGFTHVAPTVYTECISGTRYWCYGTGWLESRLYAPDKTTALRVIRELSATLDSLAP